jgi:two-component system chemotaxis response regulator CheY
MIVIAEDNPQMRRMIRNLIEDIDSEIAECSDGTEAMQIYDEHQPDWLLMDIGMRPMDGLTATREIMGRHPAARIVIVSELADTRTREKALALGASAFVSKDDLMSLRDLLKTADKDRATARNC